MPGAEAGDVDASLAASAETFYARAVKAAIAALRAGKNDAEVGLEIQSLTFPRDLAKAGFTASGVVKDALERAKELLPVEEAKGIVIPSFSVPEGVGALPAEAKATVATLREELAALVRARADLKRRAVLDKLRQAVDAATKSAVSAASLPTAAEVAILAAQGGMQEFRPGLPPITFAPSTLSAPATFAERPPTPVTSLTPPAGAETRPGVSPGVSPGGLPAIAPGSRVRLKTGEVRVVTGVQGSGPSAIYDSTDDLGFSPSAFGLAAVVEVLGAQSAQLPSAAPGTFRVADFRSGMTLETLAGYIVTFVALDQSQPGFFLAKRRDTGEDVVLSERSISRAVSA